jgi:ATP-binding cassette, subfamily B, bacterial
MYVLGGSRTTSGKRAGPTIYELNAHGANRPARCWCRCRLAFAGQSAGMLQESAIFIYDFVTFTEHAPPRPEPLEPWPAGNKAGPFGPIRAEGVTFSYPGSDRVALRDISMCIEPGEVVALVGANGSGKTTLARVLAGLYLPSEGRVCWDGRDTREVDRREVLAHTAVVFQDFIRYALSAGDNIALGRHERALDAARIVRAAEQAGADREISALPSGYETLLGPAFIDGTDLSTRQWQRVALARTFFRDAPHAELLALGGTYAELFTLQASPYQ